MSTKLFNHRLLSALGLIERSLTIKPNFNLSKQMKSLNDTKQFRKTLQLFKESKESSHTDNISSRSIIFPLLKACAELKDLHFGSSIHHRLSNDLKHDPYIITSLVYFYGKE